MGEGVSSIVVSLAGLCGWAAAPPPPSTARLSAVNRRPDSGDGRQPLPAPSLPLSHLHPIQIHLHLT